MVYIMVFSNFLLVTVTLLSLILFSQSASSNVLNLEWGSQRGLVEKVIKNRFPEGTTETYIKEEKTTQLSATGGNFSEIELDTIHFSIIDGLGFQGVVVIPVQDKENFLQIYKKIRDSIIKKYGKPFIEENVPSVVKGERASILFNNSEKKSLLEGTVKANSQWKLKDNIITVYVQNGSVAWLIMSNRLMKHMESLPKSNKNNQNNDF